MSETCVDLNAMSSKDRAEWMDIRTMTPNGFNRQLAEPRFDQLKAADEKAGAIRGLKAFADILGAQGHYHEGTVRKRIEELQGGSL